MKNTIEIIRDCDVCNDKREHSYGLRVSQNYGGNLQSSEMRDITNSEAVIMSLYQLVKDTDMEPVHLRDVVMDYFE